jgi:hypothetical protein
VRSILLLLALVACCPVPAQTAAPETKRASRAVPTAPPPRLGELTGGYEHGASRMCILSAGRGHRFALVIRGEGSASCSGSGTVSRDGAALRFTMRGDSACSWNGRIEGNAVRFTSGIDPGCAYYCGGEATLAGVALEQRGTGRAAAMRAKDLVGEPLCTDE